jgi:hypothetical protein
MKPKQKQTDELTELFDELNIDAQAASEMRHDLQTGDALLNEQSEPDCPAKLIEKITRDIEKQSQGLSWTIQLRRIAAVLVLGLVLVGLFELSRKPIEKDSLDQHAVLLADEYDIIETALDLELEEFEVDFDNPEIADILSLWDDAGWELQQLFGKEFTDETDTISYHTIVNDWIA